MSSVSGASTPILVPSAHVEKQQNGKVTANESCCNKDTTLKVVSIALIVLGALAFAAGIAAFFGVTFGFTALPLLAGAVGSIAASTIYAVVGAGLAALGIWAWPKAENSDPANKKGTSEKNPLGAQSIPSDSQPAGAGTESASNRSSVSQTQSQTQSQTGSQTQTPSQSVPVTPKSAQAKS